METTNNYDYELSTRMYKDEASDAYVILVIGLDIIHYLDKFEDFMRKSEDTGELRMLWNPLGRRLICMMGGTDVAPYGYEVWVNGTDKVPEYCIDNLNKVINSFKILMNEVDRGVITLPILPHCNDDEMDLNVIKKHIEFYSKYENRFNSFLFFDSEGNKKKMSLNEAKELLKSQTLSEMKNMIW